MVFKINSYHIASVGLLGLFWKLRAYARNRMDNPKGLPLPPGPKPYPIIGNLLDFPSFKPWLVYDEWFKTYGKIVYFAVLGQPFLIIGSHEIAYDLFEKRSSNYSDRPKLPMLVDLMDSHYNFGLFPYGIPWRRHRRVFHEYFHPNIVSKYEPIQTSAARTFLQRLLQSPDHFREHMRLMFAATIMKVAYGITVKELDDPYIQVVEEVLLGISAAGVPGAFLVDIIPAMKYIPSWFPGAGWKRKALHWRYLNGQLSRRPFEQVKKQMEAGTAIDSVATSGMESLSDKDESTRAEEEIIISNACAVAYAGGADTVLSIIETFFMAMALYPDVQKKAQAELDTIIGTRLPEFDDRPDLPYINAMVKEAFRWQQVVPIGVPHMTTNSDEYEGYYIPKGTVVIGNSWSMLHDPEVFDDPLTYNPERYLKDGQLNPAARDPNAAFGFGRRVCPGRFFANKSIFITMAHVLSAFDIQPPLDDNGKVNLFKPDMSGGMISYPVPFGCRITPRNKLAEQLIIIPEE